MKPTAVAMQLCVKQLVYKLGVGTLQTKCNLSSSPLSSAMKWKTDVHFLMTLWQHSSQRTTDRIGQQ